jgi:hypothetical protein
MFCIASFSQDKNIETESIALDDLIAFIIEHYSVSSDSTETKNVTFLIETYKDNFNAEDSVILKQAFKLLSKRLSEKDLVSIVAYSKYSGVILNQANGSDIKKFLYAIENPKSSIKTFEEDGIELAYKFANENFVEDSENSVVMIRIPNKDKEVIKTDTSENVDKNSKNKSNVVVLTAIALLPELISVIKD